MVLLSPSIGGLRKLVAVCESYAEAHGLVYNAKKSEILVFKAGKRTPRFVPPITLNGSVLKIVCKFKYLGHIVTADLKDDEDIQRERRALAVRCNMLARRFARCTGEVKITLFKAFCQSFYSSGLWVSYTRRAYSALRVQYNNAFRALMQLPRFCSASGMFADARTDGFHAIMRKKASSLLRRMRASSNSVLRAIAARPDCPIQNHWIGIVTGQIK
ncbi:hypothetical protein ABMA28_002636 [Loxostege sticticalis]|uniref:Reverse transcriptase n=1 Tax=Loxostege sticticalis TaxID=481309 RepID=A0ABD0SYR6_LOXSC